MIRIKIGQKEYSPIKLGGAVLAVLAALVTVISQGETLARTWPKVAWTSQHGHEADIARLEDQIEQALMATAGEVGDFRDEWKCDEYEEELAVLLDKLDDGSATAQDRERIRRIREIIGEDGLDCARFEEQ